MQKRGTIVRDYKQINFGMQKEKGRQEDSEDRSTFLDNYFLTTEGKKALAQMPEWVFRAKEIHQPAQLDP